jgi:hypothetical protein
MRTITLEEHCAPPGFINGAGHAFLHRAARPREHMAKLLEQIGDVGEKRIAEMDAAGVDMQVLSLNAPGVEQLNEAEAIPLAREANDFIADAVKHFPTRFAGLATVPTAAPEKAAKELERAVREQGMKGLQICGHHQGRYLDDKFFWPILEQAEALGVPIYLHPTPPPKAVIDAYYGGFSPELTFMFSAPGWGWHIETGVHIMRIILGGVFDRFPKLQFIVGHMGEALPFMQSRADIMPQAITKLERPVSSYLKENVHYTFAGFNYTPTFLDLFLQVGVERIMFSADHPYGSMATARKFLDELPVSAADREKIAHSNAERLLGL